MGSSSGSEWKKQLSRSVLLSVSADSVDYFLNLASYSI